MRSELRLVGIIVLCIVVYVTFRYHLHASTHVVRLHVP